MKLFLARLMLAATVFLFGWNGMLVAGDILRGGASASGGRKGADERASAGMAAAEAAKVKAADRLARTTQIMNAMRQMQVAAGSGGTSVPDGLAPGGLEVLTGAGAQWKGADAPVQTGNRVTVRQTDQQALLNWKTFNVGKSTTLYFDQQAGGADSGKWIAFNRVLDPLERPSRILGSIKAEGQVYVINQNGIIFGGGSQVNTRTFVASTIPINDNLVSRGLLNQESKNVQFLFSTTAQGSAAIPAAPSSGTYGVIVVERGASISSPASSDGNGGRIMLVGANVANYGTLSTPSGQTILAAGLQVGIDAHPSSDPSLRGLDVYVGNVGTYAGTVTNQGMIESRQGSILLAGKTLNQNGVLSSSTSVSLNGRVDLLANYDGVPNPAYDPSAASPVKPFLYQSTGGINLGPGSATSILPEWDSMDTTAGTSLPLRSQINMQGRTVYMGPDSVVLAPNAAATLKAGDWFYQGASNTSTFVTSSGQIYLDKGALLDVSGSTGISAPMSQNLLTIELRGAQLADSPLQRAGNIRGLSLTVDIRKTGTYLGSSWVGTPLGDVSGFVGLIERNVGLLTTAGGSVEISAGGSVVVQKEATVDVSGGWVRFEGGAVKTTRLLEKGHLVNIADATPDRLYDGIYDGKSSSTHAKWGITKTFASALAPTGAYFQKSYIQGAAGGTLSITAPSMALDGDLLGNTIAGTRQLRDSTTSSSLPIPSALTLSFQSQAIINQTIRTAYPSPPAIVFSAGYSPSSPGGFALDGLGNPSDLPADRKSNVFLEPEILSDRRFGSLAINNPDGTADIPAGTTITTGSKGSLSITAANIRIGGFVSAPGGSLSFTSLNISPYAFALISDSASPATPAPNPGRGIFTLEKNAVLSAAGTLTDDRPTSAGSAGPIAPNGGSIQISGYSVNLAEGSKIDASGGAALASNGKIKYGNGGSIKILAGQDPNVLDVTGGRLVLGADLAGYSAATGGSLAVQAELVQIGGSSSREDTLVLAPAFFQSGGFSSYQVSGLGKVDGATGQTIPGLIVEPGTVVEPLAVSWRLIPFASGGGNPRWAPVVKPQGIRPAAGISLSAAGVKNSFGGGQVVRGDLVLGENSLIETDPGASVSLDGNTVAILGSIIAPAGSIAIKGGTNSLSLFGTDAPLVTVYISPRSTISAAGTVVYSPDPYGRRLGSVLPGGQISIKGNIYAAEGAVIDVSGASGILDVPPAAASLAAPSVVPASSGLTTPLENLRPIRKRIDSDGGTISLAGGQILYSRAAILGKAGGPSAAGGTLEVSSGKFYSATDTATPFDVGLTVTQASLPAVVPPADSQSAIGSKLKTAGGGNLPGLGYFDVSAFENGGFDSLSLKGIVQFSGRVAIRARNTLRVADGGVLYADSDVRLTAPYVALGTAFQTPSRPEDVTGPFGSGTGQTPIVPAYGPGSLTVEARLIDVGFLSLQNIGEASLTAAGGDIRGDGTLHIAGRLTLTAAQIYPVTASAFTVIAYDYLSGGVTRPGTINIVRSGTSRLPMSAGGSLGIYASVINQGGALVAPLGTISLGWDGTGTAPTDLLAGTSGTFPVTSSLTLSAGSLTSVSAVDPVTGLGTIIPYGISTDGSTWVDPRGVDITAGGLPAKNISLSATNISMASGSTLDLRGGGDLYAYRWVAGQGGSKDILGSAASFAVIPGYSSDFSPYSTFNSSGLSTNLISGTGYANSSLRAGDKIFLNASTSLPAGYYTLLPARYALLPGAVLVTPISGVRAGVAGAIETPEGANLVSGYRFNSLDTSRTLSPQITRFEVLSSAVLRNRAQYEDYFANTFLAKRAAELGVSVQRLPTDSASAVIQAGQSMALQGSILSKSISGGRGASLDISSTRDFYIASNGASGGAGAITLDAQVLNGFGVETLLIGGLRTATTGGTMVSVKTGSITLAPGAALAAPEIILASNAGITLSAGSSLQSADPMTSPGEKLLLNGNGVLVRVSADPDATISRTGATTAAGPSLVVGTGAFLQGAGLTLDSSSATSLDPAAVIAASSYYLNSGQVSLGLNNPGILQPTTGLVLGQQAISGIQSAGLLSLLSYSSIDLYGTGTVGSPSLAKLVLSAGEIRGFNQAGGTVGFSAQDILIDNAAAATAPGPVAAGTGTLSFNAGTIRLGSNQVAVDQFPALDFFSSISFVGEGTGGLSTQGALNVTSPLITGAAGASRTLAAAGAINLLAPPGPTQALVPGGLGATYSITGLSLNAATNILLPSGSLSLRATGGNLEISARLDVSGTQQDFYDVTKYTSGGTIQLASDTGNVALAPTAVVRFAAQAGGGDAGKLAVSAPVGTFTQSGTVAGAAGAGGKAGSFDLDVLALPSLSAITSSLAAAGVSESQVFRVRSGDVVVDGTAAAHTFNLSADQGSITVTGFIDAHGSTGGSVDLAANKNVTLASGSRISVAAADFDDAGKGGSVTLEADAERIGLAGTGAVGIRAGSAIDLSVASKIAGDAGTPGTSAYEGKFSGTLHLRAAQNAASTDLNIEAIDGTILGASSILAEGYKIFDLTGAAGGPGVITSAVQTNVKNNGVAFASHFGAVGTAGSITDRMLANNAGLAPVFVLAPGAEIIDRSGSLTLGTTTSTASSDWDLSSFRFGPKSAPGVLTLRASDNIVFYNALSDGFKSSAYDAALLAQNLLLPVNAQSWSYRLVAGADLSAADFSRVRSTGALAATAGFVKLGKNNGNNISNSNGSNNAPGNNAKTSLALTNRFQVIRTGSGNIDIAAGRSVQLLNEFATIYTAGTQVADPTMGGTFDVPILSQAGGAATLGTVQQDPSYPAQYAMAGGNINIAAGQNIEHLTLSGGQLVADSQRQLPNNWLSRRGYIDPATGASGTGPFGDSMSTAWWVDYSNFFQSIGALGGGNVALHAGQDISNVDAVAPTNARMPKGVPSAGALLEFGGGDVTVTAGRNIDAGVYYVELGHGTLDAGGQITTDSTRSPSVTHLGSSNILDPLTWLPTTLFLGKGGFDVSAKGNLLLGPVANTFLLPGGINNTFWDKTYFSTYAPGSFVNASSLGGTVTLRESATFASGATSNLLYAWLERELLLKSTTAAYYQPWLRLNENSVQPFASEAALLPPTLRAVSFSGDIDLVGSFTLAPSATGTIDLLAAGNLNGLNPSGSVTVSGAKTTAWISSQINVSDANPSTLPSAVAPFAYQSLAGTTLSQARQTQTDFLLFIANLFGESGATLGSDAVLQKKAARHASAPIHAGDPNPLRLYAGGGDISGMTLFSPKFAQVFASRDITDVAFYIQNLSRDDSSVVSSGRDIIPYDANSVLRASANSLKNTPASSNGPLAGDIQISGPGTLEVLAGKTLDLGTGSGNNNGTGDGITSVGNARNPYLPLAGASLVLGAGIDIPGSLTGGALDFGSFISSFINSGDGKKYVAALDTPPDFSGPLTEATARAALKIFYLILRDAGRAHSLDPSAGYAKGFDAINSLFTHQGDGEILTRSRNIRTRSGGSISIFNPGGGLTLANTAIGTSLTPPGIITESGGDISIFARDSIDIGIGRIFTLRGGNQIIWSSTGDIAAGSSSKTVQTAPPTRVLLDPQSADLQTDLAGLATGGGIGVLATVKGVAPGDVDLVAPAGVVDAGDAGIRVTGNLNIAATAVLNAGNIAAGGTTAGVPVAPSVTAPNIGGLSSGASSSAAANAAAQSVAGASRQQEAQTQEDAPSIIQVQVLGYGGGESDDQE